jgi:hypothetical protein
LRFERLGHGGSHRVGTGAARNLPLLVQREDPQKLTLLKLMQKSLKRESRPFVLKKKQRTQTCNRNVLRQRLLGEH